MSINMMSPEKLETIRDIDSEEDEEQLVKLIINKCIFIAALLEIQYVHDREDDNIFMNMFGLFDGKFFIGILRL